MRHIGRTTVAAGLVAGAFAVPFTSVTAANAATINLCGHPADTVPPQISSVTFSSPTVDTTAGPATVTITAAATDTATSGIGSGVKSIFADLAGPRSYLRVKLKLTSGTSTDGTWTGTATFTSKRDYPGTYKLEDVYATDLFGNSQDYYGNQGKSTTLSSPTAIAAQSGWDTTITLTGPKPTHPKVKRYPAGKLALFKFSPTSVNTTSTSKRVHVEAGFTGRQPKYVYANFNNFPQPGQPGRPRRFYELHFNLHKVGKVFKGHATVKKWLGDLTLRPQLGADFNNSRPGFRDYDASQLNREGAAASLGIKSTLDKTPPSITSFSFSPTSIDTTTAAESMSVTANVSDAISGVKSVYAEFYRNDDRGIQFLAGADAPAATYGSGFGGYRGDVNFEAGGEVRVKLTQSGSAWTGTANFAECVPSGKWNAEVIATDKAGNGKYLSGKQLAKIGPSSLQVKAAPQYVFDPVVVAATASGAGHTITLDFDHGVQNLTTSNLAVYAMAPAAQRYTATTPISNIQCSNGTAYIACDGSAGFVTSAVLTVPAVTGGQNYEVWADLGSTTSQITDAGGLPVPWDYAIAQVRGD